MNAIWQRSALKGASDGQRRVTDELTDIASEELDWPSGAGMVYFGMSAWLGMWKSRHQLMYRFSNSMPVLYVEPWVGLRSLRTGKTRKSRLLGDVARPNLTHFDRRLYVFRSPAYLPVSRSSVFGQITQDIWLGAVRRAARKIGISRPILWISRPETGFVLKKVNGLISIYHAVDEYAGYTGLNSDAVERLRKTENEVLDTVDLSIVASPELQSAKAGAKRDIIVVENGVEPEEYERARMAKDEPDDLASIPHPRIGYSGLIGKRLDLALIKSIAVRRPTWSIVLIGKVDSRECESSLTELRALKNVHFLGEKPAAMVAAYIAGLDIGLLPYSINLETRHISPIKMYEYWAAGIPVVSTPIPAAIRNESAVHLAKDADGFLQFAESLLAEFSAQDSSRLRDLARKNSWQSRVDEISRALHSRLDKTEIPRSGMHLHDSSLESKNRHRSA
jgi:glycosyltransferase involved in cell wall biosynthesis